MNPQVFGNDGRFATIFKPPLLNPLPHARRARGRGGTCLDGLTATLKIEGNARGGRVICKNPLDYKTLTPIQSFLLACGSHYGLTLELKDCKSVDF